MNKTTQAERSKDILVWEPNAEMCVAHVKAVKRTVASKKHMFEFLFSL